MNYVEAVQFINQVLRSVNVNADQHDTIKGAFRVLLQGPAKEPDNGNDAVPVSGAIQSS